MSHEDRVPGRPLRPIPNASDKARTAFADALVKKGVKMTRPQAEAIARALVDPKAALHALRYPHHKRIPTGSVTTIQVEVFLPAVSVSPANPRENEHREYPIGIASGKVAHKAADVASGAGAQAATLRVVGDGRAHLEGVLHRSVKFLRQEQADSGLQEKLALDGVLKPLTVAVATFKHTDGSPDIETLIAIDGSSRVAVGSLLLAADPVDAVYRWPSAPRQFSSFVGQIARVFKLDPSERTEKAEQAHRVLTSLADVIIGTVDLYGEPLPMLEACRSLMSDVHVEKPLDWPEGGQRDQLADAVLAQLSDSGTDPVKVQYFAGTLPRALLPPYLSPELDVRAAEIVGSIYDVANRPIILQGLRSVGTRKRLRQSDRPEIATELVLRAIRTGPDSADKLTSRRASMIRTITDSELIPKGGNVGQRSPELIRDAALAELAGSAVGLQRDRQELGFLGAYWLVVLDALLRDKRQRLEYKDENTFVEDPRTGAMVVKQMLESAEGIHQLYQAIVDGRAGRGKISEVDENGAMLPTYVSDLTLRNRFKPLSGTGYTPPPPRESSPSEKLAAEADALLAQARELVLRRDRLRAIEDEDSKLPLVVLEGLDTAVTDVVSKNLREVAGMVDGWGATFTVQAMKRERQRQVGAAESAELQELDIFSTESVDVA